MSRRTLALEHTSRILGKLIGALHNLDDRIGIAWFRSLPEVEKDSIMGYGHEDR